MCFVDAMLLLTAWPPTTQQQPVTPRFDERMVSASRLCGDRRGKNERIRNFSFRDVRSDENLYSREFLCLGTKKNSLLRTVGDDDAEERGRGILSHRAHGNVASAHQARIAPRLDHASQPVRIGHGFVHWERRRAGERVLGAPVARVGRALHGRPRGNKILIITFVPSYCFGTYISEFSRNQFILKVLY